MSRCVIMRILSSRGTRTHFTAVKQTQKQRKGAAAESWSTTQDASTKEHGNKTRGMGRVLSFLQAEIATKENTKAAKQMERGSTAGQTARRTKACLAKA